MGDGQVGKWAAGKWMAMEGEESLRVSIVLDGRMMTMIMVLMGGDTSLMIGKITMIEFIVMARRKSREDSRRGRGL